jgi:RHS repeat-associated protein
VYLGGQVVAEVAANGDWARGYVYLGSQLLAVQHAGVYWVHQDPIVKSKRITNSSGNVVSTVELDPWGGHTNRNSNSDFQPQTFNNYMRDGNVSDEAMFRRYNRWWSRFDQPDPYDGSYDLSDPQSFNRYAYTKNDPVNFVDPTGLLPSDGQCQGAECPWGGGGGGFWGGGSDMNRHVSLVGSWGLQTIVEAEIALYPFELQIRREWSFDYPSAFIASPFLAYSGPVNRHLIPRKNAIKKMDCGQLANTIDYLTGVLAERAQQLVENKGNLPPTGPGSIAGHRQQFGQAQSSLREALEQFDTKGCGPPRNPNAWHRATQPAPHPKPKPSQPIFLKPGPLFPTVSPVPATAGAATLTLALLLLMAAFAL